MVELWWEEIIHAGQDARDYELNDEHQTQYIIDITIHEANICQQTMAWVLNQNIEATLNGMNPITQTNCMRIWIGRWHT
jgi:hypothetical protein